MIKTYIVVETCGGEITAWTFANKTSAEKFVEGLSGQDKERWAFDDGTVYDGYNNYETTILIMEDKLRSN